ncbi:Uu.00g046380.m01.CDS01 [Anthostomella pinea]|uniref:Uu.00g046380.m01.CDS01 n=1 Tax=Anthostomella pinea TaxID=933095 RepID=A0AAI8VBC4_9PEZI|nr:Uu.00g046380.m01.CDS01 [Anthostomella pinea]
MDESGDPEYASFGLHAPANLADRDQLYHPFWAYSDTVAPSNLSLHDAYHPSHDDRCIDLCRVASAPQRQQPGAYPPSHNQRARNVTTSPSYGSGLFAVPSHIAYIPPWNCVFPEEQDIFTPHHLNHGYANPTTQGFTKDDLGTLADHVPDDCLEPAVHKPCNHTPTEHVVAHALSNMGAPGVSNAQNQTALQQPFSSLEITAQPTANHQVFATPTEPDRDLASSPFIITQPACSKEVSQEIDGPTGLPCQWLVDSADSATEKKPCGHILENVGELQTHIEKDHVSQMSGNYPCMWKGCTRQENGQPFTARGKLNRHVNTHSAYKPYECVECHQGFSAQQALDQHIRIHTGDMPYKCPYHDCGKKFKQKSALTMHQRTHTQEKPLKCDVCGRCFGESSNLSKHRKIHKAHFNHICSECGRGFIRLDQLKRHEGAHERHKKKLDARSRAQQSTPSAGPTTPEDTPFFASSKDEQFSQSSQMEE